MGNVGNIGQSDPRRYSPHFTWVVSLRPKPRSSGEVKAQNTVIKGPRLWPEPSQLVPFCLPRVGTEVRRTTDPQSTAQPWAAPQPMVPRAL